MKILAAVDLDWGIGYEGDLLIKISEDMRLFKSLTVGNVIVMGRGTMDSLPGSKPLSDRINIVLSRNPHYVKENAVICHSLEELFVELRKYSLEDIFVIGGEAIFNQLLPYCHEAYITKIDRTFPADKYLINIDQLDNWQVVEQSEDKFHQDVKFRFFRYCNQNVLDF